MRECSHSECPAMCICNMLLSSLCHAELLKSDWLEGWPGVFFFWQAGAVFRLSSCVTGKCYEIDFDMYVIYISCRFRFPAHNTRA